MNEVQYLRVVRHVGLVLTMPLPFEHRRRIWFRFNQQRDKGPRWIVFHCFQHRQVLAAKVVKALQFFAAAILHSRDFENGPHVRLLK